MIKRISILLIVFSVIMTGMQGLTGVKTSAATTLSDQTEKIVNKKVRQTVQKRN